VVLVDTNVLLDVLQNDPQWADWSQGQLESAILSLLQLFSDSEADCSGVTHRHWLP